MSEQKPTLFVVNPMLDIRNTVDVYTDRAEAEARCEDHMTYRGVRVQPSVIKPDSPLWARHAAKLGLAVLLLLLAVPALAQEPCRVNVATCTAQQCSYLPGIGPSKGAAIEAAHPADETALDAVDGIGDATLAKVRPFVVYQGDTTCTSKQAAPKPEAGKDGAQ